VIPLIRTVGASVALAALAITSSSFDPSPPADDLTVVPSGIAPQVEAVSRRVVVERVIDGDTIAVTGDERVRLLTINAPELRGKECGSQEASDALRSVIPPGTPVLLAGLKGEPARDRYGRTLSSVLVQRPAGLTNVALLMVAEGRARVYDAYPTSETDDAMTLQTAARAAGRGLWGTCVPSS